MEMIEFLLFFLFLISLNNCIIVIPFKTFIQEEPDNFESSDVINYWGKNIIYSHISIGTPPQKIIITISSQNYASNLYQHMCDISESFYENNKSSSFYIKKVINKNYPMNNASIIKETLYLYDSLDLKELKPFDSFEIIYSDNDKKTQGDIYEYHKYTCINTGFQLSYNNYIDASCNLINQLKQNYEILETYDFTLRYNSEDEGEIVIGSEPHIYDPENYYEQQYRIVGAMSSENLNLYNTDWFLYFDKIYYSYKSEETGKITNETLIQTKGVRIHFDLGIVLGSNEYEDALKKIFFNELIIEKKCFVDTVIDQKDNTNYNVYYCDKALVENKIKNEFPNIYFEMKQFNKIFELTYKDLFREKNGKLYFLMYFKKNTYYGNNFVVGKIFLKKYFFTFNQDTKMIGYYNEDLPGGRKTKKNGDSSKFYLNKYAIILVIFLFVIFGVLGFTLGKIIFDKVRKKRINEVDENYDYFPQGSDNALNLG